MKIKGIVLGCMCAILLSPCVTRADTSLRTGAEVTLNNIDEDIDYKLTEDELDNIHDKVNSYTNLKSLDRDESELFMTTDFTRNVTDLEYYSDTVKSAETWLIENNVYSRPVRVNLKDLSVEKLYGDLKQDYDLASKSDFLMMLYKAECGVIQSNVVNESGVTIKRISEDQTGLGTLEAGGATSVSDYWDDGVSAELGYDQINYVSANVYELYLEQMLNKGVIKANDLGGKQGKKFRSDLYDKDGNVIKDATGAWRKTATNYFEGGSDALGYANTVEDGTVIEGEGNYFIEEKMTVLEALHYVAEFMRMYENISNTEADMIAYKYGLTEFAGVDAEYLEDVYYLVGAGIISFDGSGPKYYLAGGDSSANYLTQAQMYDLMYRVANKGARFTFNVVQLTDAETTLKDAGFIENEYTYLTTSAVPYGMSSDFTDAKNERHERGSVGDEYVLATSSTLIAKLDALNIFNVLTTFAAGETKEYLVTKQFDYKYKGSTTGNVYKYYSQLTQKEYLISTDDEEGSLGNASVQEELGTEFESITTETVGDYEVYTVVFRVHAYTGAAALKYVNQRVVHTAYSNDKHSISALTKVEDDGEETTMISQESLKGIDSIVILHDRVLMNKDTKAKCLIQNSLTKLSSVTDNTQYGYAIIGSQILSGEPIMIEGSDDSVYYNLKCVLALLPESSYGKLGLGNPGKVNNTLLGISLHKEYTTTYTYGLLNQDTSNFTYIRYRKNRKEQTSATGKANVALYNMTNLYKGMTTLSRTFQINFGKEVEDVTFIVDLAYYAPSSSSGEYDTVDDYQLALTTPPDKTENPVMYHYWYRNYALSNALCNMLYGTKDVVYVKSGYFVPKLTILLPESFGKKDSSSNVQYKAMFSTSQDKIEKLQNTSYYKTINKFMYENFRMSSEYAAYLPSSSTGNSTVDGWWTTYYGGKAKMLNQFTSILGDKTLAEQLLSMYTNVGAQSITVAIARSGGDEGVTVYERTVDKGTSDQTTQTNVEGSSTTTTVEKSGKTIYAVLTDCNILYRNVNYPRTLATSNGASSVLNVTWNDKSKKLISRVTVETGAETESAVAPSSGIVRTFSKLYKTSGKGVNAVALNANAAYEYKTSGKSYVLTPLYAPVLLATPSTSDAGRVYLGKGENVGAVNAGGSYGRTDASGNVACIGKSGLTKKADVEALRTAIANLQVTRVLPDFGSCTIPTLGSTTEYGKWVKNNLMADLPDTVKEAVGKGNAEYFKLPNATVEQYRESGSYYVKFGYVYKKDVVLVDFTMNASGDWIATNLRSVKLNKMFDVSGTVATLRGEYKDVHFFNCYKFQLAKTSGYVDSTKEYRSATAWPKASMVSTKLYLHHNLALAEEMTQKFYSAALNDQVIKATVGSKMSLVDVDEIASGARLNIGETVWVKNGEYWESYPIKITGSPNQKWKRILKSNNYSGASCYRVLANVWWGYAVTFEGNSYLLKNYVDEESVALGTGYLGAIPSEVNSYTKQGILAMKNNDVVVYKSSGKKIHENAANSVYKYVTLKFKFQEGKGLKALPVNSAGTEYELMFDADAYSNGADLAIFSDDLDFTYDDEAQVTVSSKDDLVSEELRNTNKEFRTGFVKTTAVDAYQWVRYVILILTCWLFFMLWFAYYILKRGIAYKFLETLAKPGFRKQGKGLDVIKLFTLGILNVDSEPRFNQMMGMTVLLIFIDVLVGYIL